MELNASMSYKWFRYSRQFRTFYFHSRHNGVIFPGVGLTSLELFLARKPISIMGKYRTVTFIHKEDIKYKVMETGLVQTVIMYRDVENGVYLINAKGIAHPW